MSLVVLAMRQRASAFFSQRTVPSSHKRIAASA